ncbi:MAG: AAA domain-containing protein [Symploca sp. SIO2E6]|nr:AAA domain-containing protein [Symploca sp. SIO2E6]
MDTRGTAEATVVTEKTEKPEIQILPYTKIVGQEQIKLALELAYIAPRIGGILLNGERGTGKSTAVRAFAQMMYDSLPVTLPINATEDRVVGGWQIDELMKSKPVPQPGLLEEANGSLLYIDEVNLLDDHIVNMILDVTSTGVLVIQREGQSEQKPVSFTLVGTMNPEEGGLRPQLLDRFGLMVSVKTEKNEDQRTKILDTVLGFDKALSRLRAGQSSDYIKEVKHGENECKKKINAAKDNFYNVDIHPDIVIKCVKLAKDFEVEGNRGDYIIALAACAYAARKGEQDVAKEHVAAVAPLALQHRRPGALQSNPWTDEDDKRVKEILSGE